MVLDDPEEGPRDCHERPSKWASHYPHPLLQLTYLLLQLTLYLQSTHRLLRLTRLLPHPFLAILHLLLVIHIPLQLIPRLLPWTFLLHQLTQLSIHTMHVTFLVEPPPYADREHLFLLQQAI